jgi:hypothetical protein
MLGAPTVQLKFVNVDSLKAIEPQMAHFGPGLALGSRFIDGSSDRIDGIQYLDHGDNRDRFARLALLYSWAKGGDCQFIYQDAPPCLVYSNDHGHFFPGQNGWTVDLLNADIDVVPHAHFASCNFVAKDVAACKALLGDITYEDIGMIVKAPPQEWNVAHEDRAAILEYLVRRRDLVLALYL